jgi:glycosyltransferase involved in cell wall biosynthesis
MSEVVQHDATGLQVEPGSVSQIAEALRLLERDPALRQQLGRAGAERHAQLYRLDLVGEAITRIYHEVVAGE